MNKFVTIISLSIILSYTGCNLSDCYKIEEDVSYEALNHILIGPIVYNDDFTVSLSDAAIFAASVRPNRCFKIEPYVLEKDTVLYFINYDEGWLIIAGDKRINPFVAESERGNLSMPTLNENLNVWIDSYADEIHVIRDLMKKEDNKFTELWLKLLKNKTQCIIKPQIPATKSAVYKWAVVKHTYCDSEQYQNVYPHLLTTKWGQGNPWNAKLPIDSNAGRRCFTGCTAVAISQILFYLHYHINKPLGLYHNIAISKSNISGKTTNIGFSRSGYVANSARWNQMALSA